MTDEQTNETTQTELVPKAELVAAQERLAALEASHKSVQRELERARRSGQSVSTLEARLDAIDAVLVPLASAVDKIATATKDEIGYDGSVGKALAAHSEAKKAPNDETKARAGDMIVAAAEASGIKVDDFVAAWTTDERFAAARAYWEAGSFEKAISAFQVAVAKPKREDEVKRRVDEELARSRRETAAQLAATNSTSSTKGVLTMENFTKMPMEERLKIRNDPVKWAQLMGSK